MNATEILQELLETWIWDEFDCNRNRSDDNVALELNASREFVKKSPDKNVQVFVGNGIRLDCSSKRCDFGARGESPSKTFRSGDRSQYGVVLKGEQVLQFIHGPSVQNSP